MKTEKVSVSHFADSPQNRVEAETESRETVTWVTRSTGGWRERETSINSFKCRITFRFGLWLQSFSCSRACLQNHCTAFELVIQLTLSVSNIFLRTIFFNYCSLFLSLPAASLHHLHADIMFRFHFVFPRKQFFSSRFVVYHVRAL